MATKKITELTELATPAGNDLLILDDVSEVATKKITVDNILAPFKSATWFALNNAISGQTNTVSYVTVVSLPFYVTSSNSYILIDASVSPNRSNANPNAITNITSEVLLDGNSISWQGANQIGTMIGVAPVYQHGPGSICLMITASVGWHTASIGTKCSSGDWGFYAGFAKLRITEQPR
jgi:hypothetical protein